MSDEGSALEKPLSKRSRGSWSFRSSWVGAWHHESFRGFLDAEPKLIGEVCQRSTVSSTSRVTISVCSVGPLRYTNEITSF